MNLFEIGWNEFFAKHFEPFKNQGLIPARIACEKKYIYIVYTEKGELMAEVSGKFRFDAQTPKDFPAVGDWVAINLRPGEDKAIIHGVLPRKTSFSRKVAGSRTDEQVLAANIDILFLVSALDRDFNVRRIERFLMPCYNSNSRPIILLNKSDLCQDIEEKVRAVESIAFDVPIHTMSASENKGIEVLGTYLNKGITAALLGSSGVGKSTIINRLLGEERQEIRSVSTSTGKGKHVTVHRELILIPDGGLIIDTPGLRELQLWGDEDNLKESFKDIEELAQTCRFRDCGHKHEPGCAVKKAIQQGSLDMKRFKNYLKLQREIRLLATRRKEQWFHSKQAVHKRIELKRKGFFRE
ncbi:MAG: ribosome small subunit-dependent GTPase A [candidate division WOR-3 bacterium]|nr:ribosome small subunit-dependent GTPase A [candidate division WOR-3 bacterium]